MKHGHAGDHGGNEDRHARERGGDVGKRRPGAQPRHSPTDAEDRRADDQALVDVAPRRQAELHIEQWACPPEHEPVPSPTIVDRHPDEEAPEQRPAEAQRILNALERANGHRERAARSLGMSRVTLWRKMRDYGLRA